jgi:hypothetical protein
MRMMMRRNKVRGSVAPIIRASFASSARTLM